jgi:hypothetical protein
MDERRRFQVALGGIASCLLIAALFVSSAPPLVYPAVARPEVPGTAPLLGVLAPPTFLPSTTPSPTSRVARPPAPSLPSRSVAHITAAADLGISRLPVDSERLRPRATTVVLAAAPDTHARAVEVSSIEPPAPLEDSPAGRGPVTGAFVTAGKEVGRGFRTAGRAIKGIF